MVACKATYGRFMSTLHLHSIMTAQDYIQSKLEDLKTQTGIEKPANKEQLKETIFKTLMSKKFRKYSAGPEFIEHIKKSIHINVERNEPINITFTHGAYKLWRFEESPQVEWGELFALMYYTNWLRQICELYKPGVWFDAFVDDLILPKLNDTCIDDVTEYKKSYQKLLNFLKPYQPENYKMTITGVGDQFESPSAFDKKLQKDIKKFAANLPSGLPEVTESRAAMIELNVKPNPKIQADLQWMAKNVLVHDAYITMTKREAGYTFRPDKILAFTQPLPSGVFLGVGSTKDSIVKFWAGVGVLKPKDNSYRQIILSPRQLKQSRFRFEVVKIKGLESKNFSKIRVLN